MELDHLIQFLTLTSPKNKPKSETFLNTEKLMKNRPRRPLLMPSHLSSILHLTKAVSNLFFLLLAALHIHIRIQPAGDPRSQDLKRDLSRHELSARPDRGRRVLP